MATRHLYYDIINGNLYTGTGDFVGNNTITVYFANNEEFTLHYVKGTKDSENGALDPSTWDKWTDLNGLAIGSTIAFDNDYIHAVRGTLVTPISVGDTSATVDVDIQQTLLNPSDKLTFFNSDGSNVTLLYSSYTETKDGFTFNFTEPSTVDIPSNVYVRVPQALYVKISNVDCTRASEGIFSFSFNAYSHKLLNSVDFSNVSEINGTFEHQIMHEGNRIKTVSFPFAIRNVLDFDNDAVMPSQEGDWVDKAYVQSFFTAEEIYQYSVDGVSWHDAFVTGDVYYRSKINTPNAVWSVARKLLYGVGIKDVQQTVSSTESGGKNIVTITLDNGDTTDVSIHNGTTPHIGENNNWFIGDEDTGITAGGQNGKTPYIGDNGNWFIGDTDTLIPASGKDGVDGTTPHIGENNNWFIGDTDTGVRAEGSNQFTNGIEPFKFTNADLSNGVLSKTFSELGIDSGNPVSVNIISDVGVIMDGDVRLAMVWTGTGLKVDLSQFGAISGTWKLVFAGGTKITGGGGGTGSGNGYTRTIISGNTEARSGYWYVCSNAMTVTLPAGNIGDYVRISTNYQTENVVVIPSNGESIDGDTEGFTLDKKSGTVEFFWTGSEWTVIEAK